MPPAPDVTRIIVLGESASAGYPFDGAGFTEMMAAALDSDSADRGRYQVINLSIHGVNTAFLREVLRDAVVEIEPDLVLVYAGNNELLGRETIDDLSHPRLSKAIWWLRRHSRIWDLPANVAGFFLSRGLAVGMMIEITKMEGEYDRALFPPREREHIRELYLSHLRQMAAICREAGVNMVLATPASNLAEWVPMKSVHSPGLGDEEKDEIERKVSQAGEMIRQGRAGSALPLLREVVDKDPGLAKGWFYLGRAEMLSGEPGLAHLEEAVEKADFHQQTPPSWNRGARDLAKELDIPLVDIDEAFRRASPGGAPGFELMLDGCHPTLKGHYLVASSLIRDLAGMGLLPEAWKNRPIPSMDELIEMTGKGRRPLGVALFNQALVLGFLYRPPEYKPVAIDYLEEAQRLGAGQALVKAYQGYLAVLLDRPLEAARFFGAARNANPTTFAAVMGGRLKPAAILDDPWLWVKQTEGHELDRLYPRGGGDPETSPPGQAECQYRFRWDGRSYVPAPAR